MTPPGAAASWEVMILFEAVIARRSAVAFIFVFLLHGRPAGPGPGSLEDVRSFESCHAAMSSSR
jgi:hypothetical protein